MTTSEAISSIIKDKYKQSRHNDDENQPLSVQPWGNDGDKRRYFLIQGLNDTHFRVYREGSRYTKNAHWYSVAGNIEDLKALARKLEDMYGSQAARRLAMKITNAIPTLEQSEVVSAARHPMGLRHAMLTSAQKRNRREYRQIRNAAFSRPEPGFSLYEGRTRGKRMRYTYDDEYEAIDSDATSTRRSARQSARGTPFSDGPTYTASGRQIRQPRTGQYGESLLRTEMGVDDDAPSGPEEAVPDYLPGDEGDDDSEPPTTLGRATRGGGRAAAVAAENPRKRKHIEGYNDIDDMSEEDDAGDEWDSDKNDGEDEDMPDADDADDESNEESEEDDDDEQRSLVVRLKVSPKALESSGRQSTANGHYDAENAGSRPEQVAAGAGPDARLANGLAHGYAQSSNEAASTPPPANSAYPTPASASFPAPDVKPTAAPLSDEDLRAHHQLVAGGLQPQPNAVGVNGWQ